MNEQAEKAFEAYCATIRADEELEAGEAEYIIGEYRRALAGEPDAYSSWHSGDLDYGCALLRAAREHFGGDIEAVIEHDRNKPSFGEWNEARARWSVMLAGMNSHPAFDLRDLADGLSIVEAIPAAMHHDDYRVFWAATELIVGEGDASPYRFGEIMREMLDAPAAEVQLHKPTNLYFASAGNTLVVYDPAKRTAKERAL